MHKIPLTPTELDFIGHCFVELLYGASAQSMQNVLSTDMDEVRRSVRLFVNESDDVASTLSEAQWRMVFNVIHATVYGLGNFELQTLTGFTLPQAVNVNLKITTQLWGTYGESKFPC